MLFIEISMYEFDFRLHTCSHNSSCHSCPRTIEVLAKRPYISSDTFNTLLACLICFFHEQAFEVVKFISSKSGMLGCEANKEPTKRDNSSCDVSLFVSHPETASQWLLELNLRSQLQASAGPVSGDETNTDTHIHWLCDLTCMLSCAHNSCPFWGFPHIDLSAFLLKANSDINHFKST